jgi:signal peptidase II
VTRKQAWARAGLVAAAVLVVDQVSKAIVRGALAPGERHDALPLLDIVRVNNDGIAFGVLGGDTTWLVVVAVGAAIGGLLVLFAANATRPGVWLPAGLLLGGALGNILDRLRDGAVTDFLKLPHWPAFNVADLAITGGVVALVLVLDAHRHR